MRKLGLVGSFAVRSLVVTVLVGAFLAWVVSVGIERAVTTEASRTMAGALNSVLLAEMDAAGLVGEAKLDTDSSRLGDAVERHLLATNVCSLNVWTPDGRVVYASEDGADGNGFHGDPDVRVASTGNVSVSIDRDRTSENERHFDRFGPVIRTFAPLRRSAEAEPIGVFEFYQPYAPLGARVNEIRTIALAVLFLGSLMMYFTHFGIVQRAANQLARTEAEVALINDRLAGSLHEMEQHSLGTLQALAAAVDAKDSYTARHSAAVADYAVATGRRLGLSRGELLDLERASLLHDVGKIGVPEEMLLKPSRLSPEEYRVVRGHSETGGKIIGSIPFLRPLVPIVRGHHERWDGHGYPDGLVGDELPLLARILAVADAFDAMTSDRPYRPGLPVEVASREIANGAGSQFDPVVVDALLHALELGDIKVAAVSISESRSA